MKTFLAFCFLGSIVFVMADINRECPGPGQEHVVVPISYTNKLGTYVVNYCVEPGPSCEEPIPVTRKLFRCGGFETCQCIPPNVKDVKTGKCIPLDECSEPPKI